MNKKIKTIKNIESKIRELYNQQQAIEQEEIEKVQYPKIKALVGVCIKSNYDDGYYRKILDCVENKKTQTLYLIFEEFYISEEGEPHLGITSEAPYTNKEWWNTEIPISGFSKISEREYQKERTKMVCEFSNQTKLKKFLLKSR